MTARGWFPSAALLALVLVGCGNRDAEVPPTADREEVLGGSVAYRERVALPPDAIVEVRLSDVSLQDVAVPVVAETTIATAGRKVPIPFELRYDARSIRSDRTYAVRATIRSAGRMIFTTDTAYHVITRGHPTRVDLWLVPVSEERLGTTSGSATRVAAIRAGLAGYRAVEGKSSAGDNEAAWKAHFDGSGVKHIHEGSRQGDYGWAENEYWFENGVLFAYDSRGSRTITDPSGPAASEPFTLHLAFDESGGMTEQSKTAGGRSAPVERTEISGATARAAFLAEEAARVAPAQVVPASSVFRAPVSRSGRLVLAARELRFVVCGEEGDGITVEDLPDGEGETLVRELGAGERGIAVMVRLEGSRLQEIRYAGAEGPDCDRLPPEGEVEARGNEPFWFVRVDGTQVLVRTPEEPDSVEYRDGKWSRPDAVRWLYSARRENADGAEQITLELIEERCADSMSGARYPFRAVLTRHGRQLDGCALEGRQPRPGTERG